MRFLDGAALWHLVWLLPVFVLLVVYAWRRREALLRRLFGTGAETHLKISRPMRFLRLLLLLASMACLLLAAARPSWGVSIVPGGGSGRDLMVVFDVSKSMLCKDVQPSRLEHGKWFVRELVKHSHGDRFGLVAFAGTAFLECPMTSDKTSFLQALDELSVESIPVGGTNIQKALESALQAFKAAESGHRAIVLITDGDELSGDSSKAIEAFRARKTPIFVVGVGDPSQPQLIQAPDESGTLRTIKDAKGEAVKSPLNEKALGELALQSGGVYVRSTSANTGLQAIEKRVAGLLPKTYASDKSTRPIERFAYPLAAAFALFLVWLCVSERGAARVAPALLLALAFGGFQVSAKAQAPQGQGGLPQAPAKQFQFPQKPANDVISEPDSKEAKAQSDALAKAGALQLFNKAVELQSSGKDSIQAAKLYETAMGKAHSDASIVSRSCQNLGVIAHEKARAELAGASNEKLKAQDLDGALKQIDGALKGFDGAESLYREGLRGDESASANALGVKADQQLLLNDRQDAEKLKKRIEELKKQLEQAKKNLQDAKDKNQQQQQKNQDKQQQNQKQDQKQNQEQQGQNQKQDQQQGQEQQGQNQKQDQQQGQEQQGQNQKQQCQNQKQDQKQGQEDQGQDAQQAAKAAKDSVDKLKDMASKLEQKKMEDSADKASKEMDKAQKAQEKGDDKEAAKHIDEAIKQLDKGSGDDKDGKRDEKGQGKKDERKDSKDKNGQDSKDKDRPLEKSQGKPQGEPKEEKEIAPEQAESVLASMADEEKNLRDAIKRKQLEAYGIKRVEKDW